MTKISVGPKTLPLPAPVWLIGTYDEAGKPNIVTAAWVGICCSRPPCVTVSLQRPRYSYAAIVNRQCYTVNIPSAALVKQTDYAGITSGRNVNKFEKLGLTPVRSELVDAPYVQECPAVFECRLVHSHDLGTHTMFVGEVLDVRVDGDLLDEEQHILVEKLGMLVYTGSYFTVGENLGKGHSLGKELE
jgi:flavin reductase (DIM6/NTAB) family NADH-FMN oxidoreductase RutF